jgi:glycosyltransferase involved in cell wall biosynthesis
MQQKGISIILCTHNGASRLAPTLEHLCKLLPVEATELVIVDNASTDHTFDFCSNFLKSNCPFPWRIVYEENPGLVHARLKGIHEAHYDILLFCDDDNYLCADYLKIGFEIMITHQKIGALGGNGRPVFYSPKPDWFDRYSYSYAVGPQANTTGKLITSHPEIYGAASFWRKQVLLDMYQRGFKALLTGRKGNQLISGDDVEWCFMIQLMGYEIWYDERLCFEHVMPENRLHWNYYLKLKRGISAGSALLFPYMLLLNDRKNSLFRFNVLYIIKTKKVIYQYIRFRTFCLFTGKLNAEQQVAAEILKSRMQSFLSNFRIAGKQFRLLKSII